MSAPTVAVTIRASTDDGQPMAGARVIARLTAVERYQGFVVPKLIEGVTDAAGVCVLDLFPNELGSSGSEWSIRILPTGGATSVVAVTCAIPNTNCELHDVAGLPPYARQGAAEAFTTEILAARDEAHSARDAAQSAEAGAQDALAAAETARDSAATAQGETEAVRDAVAAMQSAVEGLEASTQAAHDAAVTARNEAQAAQTAATDAQSLAEAARDGAQSAQDAAETARDVAVTAKDDALAARDAAQSSASAASSSATAAQDSASSAGLSESNAAVSAGAAAQSATDAATARTGAEAARDEAQAAALSTTARPRNLLPNACFGVWSNATAKTFGGALSMADGITGGVCTTSNTRDVTVGDLVHFVTGTYAGRAFEVVAVTPNVRFTLDRPITCDFCTAYEMVPHCAEANSKALDGWSKSNTLAVERTRKDVTGNAMYGVIMHPSQAGDVLNSDVPPQHCRGRTVTLGAWVKTSVAGHASLRILDSNGSTMSAQHSGSGNWEWLEVTRAIPQGVTRVCVGFVLAQASGDVSACCPMFGLADSLGAGAYEPVPGEVLWLETPVPFASLYGGTFSSDGWNQTSVQAEAGGRLPAHAKAVFMYVNCRDSGSAGAGNYSFLLRGANTSADFACMVAGRTNDAPQLLSGWASCDLSGQIQYDINASGSNTFDVSALNFLGVQLR
ncbi:hypothetical protein ACI3L3_10110 [Desulfobaculum sp. SPO524]|uniref:hypothetical protein n=1 Tax=Desulfobaculum sp. SPO524 TaxID=3378071 RepID=UPI003854FD0E